MIVTFLSGKIPSCVYYMDNFGVRLICNFKLSFSPVSSATCLIHNYNTYTNIIGFFSLV